MLHFSVITGIGLTGRTNVGAVPQTLCQADVSTARKYGGTGLGLAICKELAHRWAAISRMRARPVSVPTSGSPIHCDTPQPRKLGKPAHRSMAACPGFRRCWRLTTTRSIRWYRGLLENWMQHPDGRKRRRSRAHCMPNKYETPGSGADGLRNAGDERLRSNVDPRRSQPHGPTPPVIAPSPPTRRRSVCTMSGLRHG